MFGGCLVGDWRVSSMCLEGVIYVSGGFLVGVWRVSLRVSFGCLVGVWRVS